MRNRMNATIVVLATALGVVSCGGGGGGSQFTGIDRLGVSTGTVTGFGSIFVNGVEWETAGADVHVDDNPGTESDLRIGQVVTVRGSLDAGGASGRADSVEFDHEVEGPIASIDLPAGSFVVLQQTVLVSADTELDDSIPAGADGQRGLADLAVDDIVEVSGFRDSDGAIRATRIGISGGGPFEVKGVVSNLDPGASTFAIGDLIVNYSGATLVGFEGDTLSNGDLVEARGDAFAVLPNAFVIVCTTVQREDPVSGDAGDDIEVEGYITRFGSPADFEVAGVRVTTDGGTEFEGGSAGNLALNLKIEVEGEFNASGVLVADKVEIRVQPEDEDVEIEGAVDEVNTAGGTVTLQGMDVVIRVNDVTRYEDESSASLEDFSLASLATGDHVEIRGAEDAGTPAANDVIATRIERRNASNEVSVRGPVQAELEPELVILGVTVNTLFAEFRDQDDNSINAAAFFAAIGPGDVVKAETDSLGVSANTLTADEVEIEELD